MPFSDSFELTKAFSEGDENSLKLYFNEFYPALCVYANSFTHNMEVAKEIASEAFYKTWTYREQFINPGSIRAYLYVLVRHDASRWHIKDQKLKIVPLKDFWRAQLLDHDEFSRLVKAETFGILYNTIESLPPECRKVFKLLLTGRKIAEIADLLKVSVSTVKAQKARGITLLKKRIDPSALFIISFLELNNHIENVQMIS